MGIPLSCTTILAKSKTLIGIISALALLGLVVCVAIVVLKGRARPESIVVDNDPRLTFPTPYRNVRPEVGYVGDQACASCHQAQAEGFRHTPMGRSLSPIGDIAAQERYDPKTNNPFQALGYTFEVVSRAGKIYHRQLRKEPLGKVITEHEDEVQFALGSGNHGRSYLFVREGHLYLSPISWFSEKRIWDLSPGFEDVSLSGRPIRADCLLCHCNQARAVHDTENGYEQPIFNGYAIGCERCHGPGELHVRSRRQGEAIEDWDNTIVNPNRLAPSLREAVCEQCHLLGKHRVLRRGREISDYRPGLPLHLFRSVFVSAPEVADSDDDVNQVEQMYSSRCFRSSQGKLGCISCHDPHDRPPPDKREAYYRQACLQCHPFPDSSSPDRGGGRGRGCSLPRAARLQKSKNDSCTSCHMPRAPLAQIAHAASTDHRILRNPKAAPQPSSPAVSDSGKTLLVNFHQDLLEAGDSGADRDLGISLSKYPGKTPELARLAAEQALAHLEPAVQKNPQDGDALEAKAWALWLLDRRYDALATIEASLKIAPHRESTLQYAATIAESLKQRETAIDYWRRLVDINPSLPYYRARLANLLADQEDWAPAAKECQAILRIEPANADIRFLLVQCYLQTGKVPRAQAELQTLLKLRPDKNETLRRWFDEQFR
jgi:hypothetical protein